MKRTTFAAACVLCPALLLAACAPQGAASASAFGDRPPMDESISASSADALPAEDGSILLAEGAVTLMLSAENLPPPGEASSDASGLAERDSSISYTITNTSGLELGVILIPRLERRTDGGWEAVPCDAVFCGTADPLETERSGRFPLEWYPALTPGTYRLGLQLEDYGRGCLAGGRLGDRLLHPHGKYCRAFANVRISTGFGGILTVEAKYYYEYIKQFISRRSPQQTQRCAQHSRKKHGAYGRQRCAAHSRPTAHASAAGRQPSSAAVLHAAGAEHPAPTACGNLRTRWPASWKARKNSPRDNAKRLRLEPSP